MSKDKMPDKIWLTDELADSEWSSGVTWCEDKITDRDIPYIKKSEAVSKADIQALVDLWKPYVREGLYSGELIDSIEKLLEGKDNE